MKYKFHITHQGVQTEVFPKGDFDLQWEKESDQIFLRKVCNTDFEFTGSGYALLRGIEDGCNRCEELLFQITCNSGVLFDGYFLMNKSNPNPKNCTISLSPETDDLYDPILTTWETKNNIISGVGTMVEVLGSLGDLETRVCNRVAASLAPFQAAAPYDCDFTTGLPAIGYIAHKHIVSEDGPGVYTQTTTWARMFVPGATSPPGPGWVAAVGTTAPNVGANGWARPATLGSNNVLPEPRHIFSFEYNILDVDSNGDSAAYDNGVQLHLALQRLGAPNIISNFFGINPDGVNVPANDVYDEAVTQQKMQNIIMYQISDIYKADASQNATKAILTLKEMLKWFSTYEVYWIMDGANMRIEHITYFENLPIAIDLTDRSTGEYTYDDGFVNVEKFENDRAQSVAFQIDNLIYNCADPDSEDTRETKRMYTDLSWVVDNEDQVNKDSFFMMAAVQFDGKFYVSQETVSDPFNGSQVKLNGHLSWRNILDNYASYNRPQISAALGIGSITFKSSKKLKIEQVDDTLLCCEDVVNFDANGLATTVIGDGEIRSARWNSKSKMISTEVGHNQNEC